MKLPLVTKRTITQPGRLSRTVIFHVLAFDVELREAVGVNEENHRVEAAPINTLKALTEEEYQSYKEDE